MEGARCQGNRGVTKVSPKATIVVSADGLLSQAGRCPGDGGGVRPARGGTAGGNHTGACSPRTSEQHRALIRQRVGLTYDQAQARKVADEVIRTEAAAKNDPADLIDTALEKLVETGLELPAFSTLDAMASALRAEVNKVICGIIYERLSEAHRERLLKLLTERGLDGRRCSTGSSRAPNGPVGRISRTLPSIWPGSMAWATARCGCKRWPRARSPTSPGRQPRPMPECWAITR
ncbi:DUF4158 domain-containing protein [Nonomuraea sp. NPDC049028]|uniref:DUF4158 domain-containing protein n=1 Tax=Nonomuraea sp. NPDC049028 TaxID=3364348 RepID=UPI0037169D20